MLNMKEVRRIVVKVGSSTLTYDNGKPNIRRIEQLVRTISDLQNRGFEMVLVSSGAVAVGTAKLGLKERPRELAVKQAAAAVGQCELMHIYDKMFLEYGINVAQILLTRENIVDTEQRQNIHNTFTELTKIGVVPIINENDSVATAELKHIENFGDNDTLSAVVARMCEADLLVIFSDIDGLYDSDPRKNPQAKLISHVPVITSKNGRRRRLLARHGRHGDQNRRGRAVHGREHPHARGQRRQAGPAVRHRGRQAGRNALFPKQ